MPTKLSQISPSGVVPQATDTAVGILSGTSDVLWTFSQVFGNVGTVTGGTGAASTLTLQSTSGVGTSDQLNFKTGSQTLVGFFDTGGNLSLNYKLYVLSAAGGESELQMHTNTGFANYISGFKNNLLRWAIDLGNSANETGSNVGTDFQLERYTDGQVFIDVPFQVIRSSGLVSVTNSFQIQSGVAKINTSGSTAASNWLTINNLNSGFNDCVDFNQWGNAGSPFILKFRKSRGATIGTDVILQNGDTIGAFYFAGDTGSGINTCAQINCIVDGVPVSGQTVPAYLQFATSPTNSAVVEALRLDSLGNAKFTGSLGYSSTAFAGVGGTAQQTVSRTTGVTLNKICGGIALVSAAGSATWATFTVTNSTVAHTDTIIINQETGANTYNFIVTQIIDGSFNVSVSSVVGTATEAPIFNFAVIKATNA